MKLMTDIKEKKTLINTAICFLLSFMGLLMAMKHAGISYGIYWNTVLLIAVPFMIFVFYNLVCLIGSDGNVSRKILKYALVFGWLFGICVDMGYQLQKDDHTLPGIKGKAIILIAGFGLSFLFLPITYRLFRMVQGLYPSLKKPGCKKGSLVRFFIISCVVILLGWLPVFLAYYPAIMSYDFHRQSQEAIKGFIWFYEYQPLAHTFLIRQFFLLGIRLGDLAKGMAGYSIFQGSVLAMSISAGLTFVYKRFGKVPAILWMLFFALLPFNPIMAMSVTKDIIFSAFFGFVVLLVIKMDEKPGPLVYVFFILSGIVNILFRNNAVYALVFLIPAFVLLEKNTKKKIMYAFITLVMIVCGVGSKKLIKAGMNAIGSNSLEMFSVPIMQMVRVVHYQEGNLTGEQLQILQKYIGEDSWGEYNPSISDGFKAGAPFESWKGENNTWIKDYIKIGKAYPNDYIDAFLDLTAGYWFIDDRTHAEMLGFGDDTRLGFLYTFNASTNDAIPSGIESKPYLPGLFEKYCHIVNGNSYYNWPVISYLFRPALYFWILVFSVFVCIYKRSKKSVLLLTYPVFYMMTMLLGPCVNFRYIYPFVIIAPVLLTVVLQEEND